MGSARAPAIQAWKATPEAATRNWSKAATIKLIRLTMASFAGVPPGAGMREASRKSTMPCLVKMRIPERVKSDSTDRTRRTHSRAQFAHRSDLPPLANVFTQTVGINPNQRVGPYLPLS